MNLNDLSLAQVVLPPPLEQGRLRALSQLDEGEDRHNEFTEENQEDPYSAWNQRNPCEISNDPPAGGQQLWDPLATCGVTEYRCDNGEALASLPILFDYDIYVVNPPPSVQALAVTSSSQAVVYTEERILRRVAQECGVDGCRMIFPPEDRRLGQRALQPFFGALGLQTAPTDVVEENPDSSLRCRDAPTPTGTETFTCVPVRGGFTVLTDATDSSASSNFQGLYGFVEQLALTDALVVENYIAKVVYIGKREETSNNGAVRNGDGDEPPADQAVVDLEPPVPRSGGGDSGVTTSIVLIAVAASLAALILLAMFVLRRKKRTQKNAGVVIVAEPDDLFFDVTDDPTSPESLAVKDSLALAPQSNLANLGNDAEEPNRLYWASGGFDVLGGASNESQDEGEEVSYQGASDDSIEEIYTKPLADDCSNDDDISGQMDEEYASRTHYNEEYNEQLMVGRSLSRIDESSTHEQDPEDLEFLDALSAASYDTRQSARRALQMT